MLGELDEPLEPIREADYITKSRREIKAELTALRSSLRTELMMFCHHSLVGVQPVDFAQLCEDICVLPCLHVALRR